MNPPTHREQPTPAASPRPHVLQPGNVAVVTGAASGIGLALARACADVGMRVVLADIEDAALQAAAATFAANDTVLAQRCDVTRPGDLEALAARAFDTFGAVHLLCNNAGVTGRFAPLWEQRDEEWRFVLGVNVLGLANGIRAFVPRMLAQGARAHIVNTASEAGFSPRPYVGVYHTSKFAAVGLTENLAQDLEIAGADIGVSMLCPGAVNTRVMHPERNRTPEYGTAAPPADARAQRLLDVYHQSLERGMAPAQVADAVLDAVRAGRFYVFTHDDVRTGQLERAQAIADNRAPAVAPVFARLLRG